MPNKIFCSSCNLNNYIGAYCSIVDGSIQTSTTYLINLYQYGDSRNYIHFTIPATDKKITFHFKSTLANVMNFIQFQEYQG